MHAQYTTQKLKEAEDLVLRFTQLNENELFVLRMALGQIARAALSDYQKATVNASYLIESEIY